MNKLYFVTYRTSEIKDRKRSLINRFFSSITIFESVSINGINLKTNIDDSNNKDIIYFEPLIDNFDYSKNIDYIKIWQDLFAKVKDKYEIHIIIINDTLTFGPWQGYEILCSCCLQDVSYSYITSDDLVTIIIKYIIDNNEKELSSKNINKFFSNIKFHKLKL